MEHQKRTEENGTSRLRGINAISDYYERPWNVIKVMIKKDGFPALKVYGRWESDKGAVDKWHRKQIEGVCG